ncbi:hypothetical protein P8960_01925 [Enterococcus lactis]|uniref:hypothetical protein n=1 Tax=Enterococcus lactis TaxID=357441 RepID=UPI0024159291|nr:hypothetical protein [Enterococcus lactis]MDG4615686.1 hypothetical protein [Enterococcus lactis]
MKIAFHIFADFELMAKVSFVNTVYREVVKTTCSSDDNKQAFLELDFLDYKHAAYFKELVLEHRLKKVENQYDFST